MPIVNIDNKNTPDVSQEDLSARSTVTEQPTIEPSITTPPPAADAEQPKSQLKENVDATVEYPEESTDSSFTAGFKLNNPIYNWATSSTLDQRIGATADPDYDFLAGIKGTQYEAYAEKFANTVNPQEAQNLRDQIDKEDELRQIAAQNEWGAIAGSIAGGIADPTIFIPGVTAFKAVRTGALLAEGFAGGAALGAGAIAAQEAQLQSTQVTRSAEDSFTNIAAGAVMGGIAGGLIGSYAAGKIAVNKKIIKSVFDGDTEIPPHVLDELNSLSAAETRTTIPSETNIAPIVPQWFHNKFPAAAATADKYIVKGFGLQVSGLKSPALSGITSDSFVVRDATRRLFNMPLVLKEQMVTDGSIGKAAVIPMENHLWNDAIESQKTMSMFDDNYKRYLSRSGKDPSILQSAKERDTFNEEVMKAWNRGDQSSIPEAAEAATKLRESVQRVNKRMVELNVIDEESAKLIDSGDAMRVYNTEKVSAERSQMRKALIDHYNNTSLTKQDPTELKANIDAAIDSIIGIGDDQVMLADISRLTKDKGVRFTKARTIDAPNTVLEPWLVNDAPAVANMYLRQANQMIRFQEALNDMGYDTIPQLRQGVKDEFSKNKFKVTRKAAEAEVKANNPGKYDDIKNTKDEALLTEYNLKVQDEIAAGKVDLKEPVAKQHAKLDEATAKQIDFLDDLISISLGQFAQRTAWDSTLRSLRTYTSATMLGGATLSSISDLAVPVMRHGFNKVIKGWESKIQGIGSSIKLMAKKDAEELGMIVEYQNNSIINAMFDTGSDHRIARTGVDKANKLISNVTGKVNLLEYWTGFAKNIETEIAKNDIMGRVRNFSNENNVSKTFLNEHFIDEGMAKRIRQQADKFGVKQGAMDVINIDNWTDLQAKDVMRAAVQKNVRGTVLTPGKGDVPLWMQRSEVGKTILQFKSFISAATGHIFLRGLQQKDANVASGLIAMTFTGIVSQLLKDKVAGRDIDYTAGELMQIGLANGGVLGIASDPLFGMILRNPVSSKNANRFQNKGMIEYLSGPSGSVVNTLWQILSDVGSGNITESTVKKTYRLAPYNTVFWFKGLINKFGD